MEVSESAEPGTTVQNWAWADFDLAGVIDTVSTNAVETVIGLPTLQVRKSVEAPDSIRNGDEVLYTIRVVNSSGDLSARSLEVTDTLPELLEVEETSHSEILSVNGRTLVWSVSELAPGDSLSFTIRTKVDAARTDVTVEENRAFLTAMGGLSASDSARAIPIHWDGGTDPGTDPDPSLFLELRSLALEVSLGQRVPFDRF